MLLTTPSIILSSCSNTESNKTIPPKEVVVSTQKKDITESVKDTIQPSTNDNKKSRGCDSMEA